ncbi:MAG: sigma-70 family RNA polymerase sigma factor [Nocardioidaceae bacterium]
MSSSSERLAAMWRADAPRVLSYARRHVGIDDAPDVVSETFAVAWRRLGQVPDPALPWLIGTARRIIGNTRRSHRRRMALNQRLELLSFLASPAEDGSARHDALQRLAGLPEHYREALLLVAWDGLDSEEAADATGVSAAAFRKRLQRARTALDGHAPIVHLRLEETTP